jgi:DNA-binding PadR family transcriptional regulator
MSSTELSLFSYEILGLVGRSGAGAHDLLRWARRGRMLAWAGDSQYYVEPKRLAKLGYLSARREPGKTRERTVYTLTDKGLMALREYAATPASFTPLKSDPLLRLLLADLVGEEVTREGLVALRDELAELHERLDESEETAATLPHRSTYLLLVISFLRRYLDLHAELVDEVERELVGGDAVPFSPRS